MEILGVGGLELVAFLLIALIVAGPKRLIQWSYQLGKWVSKARQMWSETAAMLQKELDNEGIDFKVPTEPPTRATLNNEIKRFSNPIAKPVQDALSGVKSDLDGVKSDVNTVRQTAAAVVPKAATPKPAVPKPAVTPKPATPSPAVPVETNANGNAAAPPTGNNTPPSNPDGGYGTWSG
jgi:Sec-independent protein translocase protein TatA